MQIIVLCFFRHCFRDSEAMWLFEQWWQLNVVQSLCFYVFESSGLNVIYTGDLHSAFQVLNVHEQFENVHGYGCLPKVAIL